MSAIRHSLPFFRGVAIHFSKIAGTIILVLSSFQISFSQNGNIIPTDSSQKNFIKAYKLIFHASENDYHTNGSLADTQLFPSFGEFSVYWLTSGTKKGYFVYPDSISKKDSITTTSYSGTYDWKAQDHLSVQFKKHPKKIAIFRSKVIKDNYSISWESPHFKSLFETFLENNSNHYINEEQIIANGLNDSTDLLIIPAIMGEIFYIDSLLSVYPTVGENIKKYLSRGGTIYAEGNGSYFLEAIGVFGKGTFNYNSCIQSINNVIKLNTPANHPLGYAGKPLHNCVYASIIPQVSSTNISIIARAASDNRPVIFTVPKSSALGGRIICNLGIPTSGGISDFEEGSRQLQWTLDAILYAFAQKIDISRYVRNELPSNIVVNPNYVSYDRLDTFDVKIVVRNLSDETINSIQLSEDLRNYFQVYEMISSDVYTIVNGKIQFNIGSLAPKMEKIIHFRLRCPNPEDPIFEQVDKFIDYGTNMAATINTTSYNDNEGFHKFTKKRNYAEILFSARIFGDADVNWKNFLNLEYQPFKVFMIMENKERTDALNTVYTQYIPKDVPFYWTDTAINIPILKTPGGKYVDILRGSDTELNPDYDLDSDGKPDAWLDTASIFPKGYAIVEDSVYWANPWEHLRTGNKKIVFEDIDHDGKVAEDTNGDGIADIQEPGDKIKVWKVTWNIGTVKGYDYFDPYCSYEIWVDPPDMVKMAAGVAKVYGTLTEDVPGMFYPYTPDISEADKNNNRWTNWMEKTGGNVVWKQYIYQHIQNYMGYTFIDTAATHYKLMPYDKCVGTTPQPHEEFIAVLSLGGEEIDMYHPTPSQSLYSKINYKTIFGEDRVTPIRTTYSYYAPLPNPLQFEYLASNYAIFDTLGNKLDYLPKKGKAHLKFDLDASTEYTYYWIRNFGHKVDRKPEWIKDPVEGMGTGVFGYMIYEIPKGMGGYKITLPKKQDGSYDTDSLVKIDGKPFQKWLDNPNTANQIQVWEDQFRYQIYIPQVLIPPALDDDNFDDVDDWIDDKGDRFESNTGYLHDAFMPGNGEDFPNKPTVPFEDLGYGIVNSGWDSGSDNTYGDDTFETLGKTHFTINAVYEGKGREGSVDISKGGTLIVEEIFGGSPWVIFSHVLAGNAKGVDYKITSVVNPYSVKYGTDTVLIKHTIEDLDEPHNFDSNCDPYHISLGNTKSTITSLGGGKDPCSLIAPAILTSTIIDPDFDTETIRLVPNADPANPDLVGYPKNVTGVFLQVKVEVMNGTNDNWFNTTVKPVLNGLGNTKVEMAYVAYPRPLVPSHELNGKIIPGDQPGTFTTGWRFNQPEGEVLVKMSDTLNLMQPTRRGYFIFLISIDKNLPNGMYSINFTIDGKRMDYKGNNHGKVSYDVPQVLFSIVNKTSKHKVSEYQKFKIGDGLLNEIKVQGSQYFEGTQQVKYSDKELNFNEFKSSTNTLPATYNNFVETINLSKVNKLPNVDTPKLYIFEKVAVNSYRGGDEIDLTEGESLKYTIQPTGQFAIPGNKLIVSPYGPKILIKQELYSVNGQLVDKGYKIDSDTGKLYIVTRLSIINVGNDVSEGTVVKVSPGPVYTVLTDSLKSNISFSDGVISVSLGSLAPGETKYADIYYIYKNVTQNEDLLTVIQLSNIKYSGAFYKSDFSYTDSTKVKNGLQELVLQSITTQKVSENVYSITVTAKNIGIPVKNVTLRIYPIIGGDVIQFPIGEMDIEIFNTGEIVTFTINYTLPNNEKIEVYAMIDDDEIISEVSEANNTKFKVVVDANGIKDLMNQFRINIFPNPFTDKINFEYNLNSYVDDVTITLFNQKGSSIVLFTNCPKNAGDHKIEWSSATLPSGTYIYRIEIKSKSQKPSVISGIVVKK